MLIDYGPFKVESVGDSAFVEMATGEEAQKAAAEFNRFQTGGRGNAGGRGEPRW
jgi:hypothetical protein